MDYIEEIFNKHKSRIVSTESIELLKTELKDAMILEDFREAVKDIQESLLQEVCKRQ